MPKPEWGVKRTCPSCAARYYDLNRDPIICPICGAVFDTSLVARPKRLKPEIAAVAAAPVVVEDEELIEDTETEEAEEAEETSDADPVPVEGDEMIGEAVDDDDDPLLEDSEEDTGLEGLEEVSPEEDETN